MAIDWRSKQRNLLQVLAFCVVVVWRWVVVVDGAVGIEAARRAGIRTIGVSRAPDFDADLVVASLEDLPADAFARLIGDSDTDS